DAPAVEMPEQLVELVLGAPLAKLADHVGDAVWRVTDHDARLPNQARRMPEPACARPVRGHGSRAAVHDHRGRAAGSWLTPSSGAESTPFKRRRASRFESMCTSASIRRCTCSVTQPISCRLTASTARP